MMTREKMKGEERMKYNKMKGAKMNNRMWMTGLMGLTLALGFQTRANIVTNFVAGERSVYDNTKAAGLDTFGDNADGAAGNSLRDNTSSEFLIGSIRTGAPGSGTGELRRHFLIFNVPELNPQEMLQNATFRIYLKKVQKFDTPPMEMSLYAASRPAAEVEIADFSSADFTDTGLGHSATESGWYEFDVTSYLQEAIDDGNQLAFRLQMDGDGLYTVGLTHNFYYAGPADASFAPELIITTIPEPATSGLFVISSGLIFVIRRMGC